MRVGGEVDVPGDKSLSHRALIFGALAAGPSHVRGLLESADVKSTAGVLAALGVDIRPADGGIAIMGRGRRSLRPALRDLDCGNSGTTARLIAGAVAGHPFAARFVGDESLSRRPMKRIKQPLEAMGAMVDLERGDGLPMKIRGGELRSIVWETSTASAQTKSAILLGALVGGVRAEVREPAPSRDHTERMLAALGARIESTDHRVALEPVDELRPFELDVPGDPSSAAFLSALAIVADEGEIVLRNVGLNERRIGFFKVVQRMGGDIAWDVEREVAGEPVGTIRARASSLRGAVVDGTDVPGMIDELVLLGCLATRATEETSVRGAEELRVKESDRISTLVDNLRAIGADAREMPGGFVVHGSRGPLRGMVRSRGDHRVAMAFGVLARIPGNEIRIDDPSCVAVSYPRFWEDVDRITR